MTWNADIAKYLREYDQVAEVLRQKYAGFELYFNRAIISVIALIRAIPDSPQHKKQSRA